MRRFLTIALALGLASCWPALGAAEIVIGVAGPFQGQYAALGEQIKRGAQQALDDINAAGGVRGETLVLKAADDGCDPRKAVDAANQFVAAGVRFVVGHYCSGSSIPASKIYAAAGLLQISPSSSLAKFTDEGDWNVLRICARDDDQGVAAGELIAAKFAAAKIAILHDQTPANGAIAARLKAALNGKGIRETLVADYTAGSKSYAVLTQQLADQGIDVLYVAGAYPEAALFLKELHDLGRGVQLISDDSLATDEFWNLAGDLGEGTLMSFTPDPLSIAPAQSVIQRFRDGGYVPEGYTLNAYAAVQALVKAMDATQSTDSRRMADWLRSGTRLDTVLGALSFTTKGDLAAPRFMWLRWSQGKYSEAADLKAP